MLIYNSMIVWIAVLGLIYNRSMACKTSVIENYDQSNKVPLYFAILVFGYIIFWVGMRSGVADTATYILGFKAAPSNLSAIPRYWTSDDVKAPGFETYKILFKRFISKDYHPWLMSIAIFSGIPIMVTLRKHSVSFFYSAFLFVVTLNFTWMLNGIRQFLAAAVLFLLSDWIVKRKTIPFIIAVLLMSTIHYTIIIMIPMYFIATGKPFGPKALLFIVVLLGCVIFLNPFLSAMETSLADTGYEGFREQFEVDDGVNPLRVVVGLVGPAIAFIGRRRIEEKNDPYINVCINMSLISAGLYFLGVFTSGILMGRLPIYFELYNLILLPYLFKNCFNEHSVKPMFILCAVGFLLYYYLQTSGLYYISDITGLIS